MKSPAEEGKETSALPQSYSMALVPFTARKFIFVTQCTTLVLEQIHCICVNEKNILKKEITSEKES